MNLKGVNITVAMCNMKLMASIIMCLFPFTIDQSVFLPSFLPSLLSFLAMFNHGLPSLDRRCWFVSMRKLLPVEGSSDILLTTREFGA